MYGPRGSTLGRIAYEIDKSDDLKTWFMIYELDLWFTKLIYDLDLWFRFIYNYRITEVFQMYFKI